MLPIDEWFGSALLCQSGSEARFMNGCKILVFFFCFHVICLFLSFLRSGIRDAPASENGHKIVSHREQSCSVQKIS